MVRVTRPITALLPLARAVIHQRPGRTIHRRRSVDLKIRRNKLQTARLTSTAINTTTRPTRHRPTVAAPTITTTVSRPTSQTASDHFPVSGADNGGRKTNTFCAPFVYVREKMEYGKRTPIQNIYFVQYRYNNARAVNSNHAEANSYRSSGCRSIMLFNSPSAASSIKSSTRSKPSGPP